MRKKNEAGVLYNEDREFMRFVRHMEKGSDGRKISK